MIKRSHSSEGSEYIEMCYLWGMVSLCCTGHLPSCLRRLFSMVTGLDSSALWVLSLLGSVGGMPSRSEEEETEVAHSFLVLPCWAVGWQRPQIPKPFSFLALGGGHSTVIIPRGLPHLWGLPSISVTDQFTNSLVNLLKAMSASPRTLVPSQLSWTSLESSHLYEPPTTRKETAHKARIRRSLNRLTPLCCHKDRQGIFLPLPGLSRN